MLRAFNFNVECYIISASQSCSANGQQSRESNFKNKINTVKGAYQHTELFAILWPIACEVCKISVSGNAGEICADQEERHHIPKWLH